MDVKFNVDGMDYTAEKGTNLLGFLRSIGKDIPSLCYHPKITETGSCRLCLVKVNGKVVTSCTQKVADSLKVITNDKEIESLRRDVFQLLVHNLNADCGSCPVDGLCELQNLSKKLDVPLTDKKTNSFVDTTSPVLEYDPNKCVKCYRCIKACQEIQGKGVLSFINRGSEVRVAAGFGSWETSECDGCGECVQICPTGALVEKSIVKTKNVLPFERFRTTCIYCGVGCQMDVWVQGGKILKVEGADDIPNRGSLCVKGRFGLDGVLKPDRLKHPLIKENGVFRKASWEEALNLVALKLSEIKDKYGTDSICGLSSAKCTNEENYIFQKFMRTTIGTNNVDHCARLCHASTVAGLMMSFGSGAMTNSIDELEHSEVILVTGSNTTEAHPVISTFIKRAVIKNGAKLIVVDPRRIDLTRFASLHLQQRNGTDVAWLNGMMNVILSEGLEDKRFIEERTEGFEEFKAVIEEYTPEKVEKITGIKKELIVEAARLFAKAKSASIVFAMGITQHTTGTDNVLSIANLSMLTGNVGKLYSGVNPLRGQNNVQGAGDVGALPNVLPGYQKVNDESARKKFEEAWRVRLSDKPGLTVIEMMNAILEGKVKALFVMGENPALSDPNLKHVREALESVDFLVVQDIYLSETAEYADVVLPACSFLEKDGTFTNTERRILKVNKIFEPVGESRTDWQIICDISTRMGYEMRYENASEIMDEIASVTPIYGGFSYDRLDEKLQWPIWSKEHKGTKFLHKDGFTRGKGKFMPVDYINPAEMPNDEYPLILSTGRILYHYHTGTISRRSDYLTEYINEPFIEIHPEDAKECGVKTGNFVKVTTKRGSIILKALVCDVVFKGSVFIPFHFKEAAANLLTNDALDPIAKIPEFKVASAKCRVEKV